MTRSIEELLPERPSARLRIYAWSTKDIPKYAGCLKVGQTTQDVNVRIKQSHGQAKFAYHLHVDEPADREDGSFFRDNAVRDRLKAKGFENVELEWMRCSAEDVLTAIQELRLSQPLTGTHHEDFALRAEQADAVHRTVSYFESIWSEDRAAVQIGRAHV